MQEHSLTKVLDEQLRQAAEVVDHWQYELSWAKHFKAHKSISLYTALLGMAVEALSALKAKRLQLEAATQCA